MEPGMHSAVVCNARFSPSINGAAPSNGPEWTVTNYRSATKYSDLASSARPAAEYDGLWKDTENQFAYSSVTTNYKEESRRRDESWKSW